MTSQFLWVVTSHAAMSIPHLSQDFDSTCFRDTDTLGLLATTEPRLAFHDIYGGRPEEVVDDYPRRPDNREDRASRVDWACLAAWALSTWPFLAEADVIVLLSDSRQPNSIPHLGHTLPWWQDRSRWAGPGQERWSCIWVPVDETTGLHRVHHTWGFGLPVPISTPPHCGS